MNTFIHNPPTWIHEQGPPFTVVCFWFCVIQRIIVKWLLFFQDCNWGVIPDRTHLQINHCYNKQHVIKEEISQNKPLQKPKQWTSFIHTLVVKDLDVLNIYAVSTIFDAEMFCSVYFTRDLNVYAAQDTENSTLAYILLKQVT